MSDAVYSFLYVEAGDIEINDVDLDVFRAQCKALYFKGFFICGDVKGYIVNCVMWNEADISCASFFCNSLAD